MPLQKWWLIFVAALIAFIFAFREARLRSQKVSDAVDRFVLKIPVTGEILIKSIYARFARTLSTTFSAGVPLVEALTSTAGATGNVVYSTKVVPTFEELF